MPCRRHALGAVSVFISAVALVGVVPALAAAPKVEVMVTGKSGILLPPKQVDAGAFRRTISGRSCVIPAATPLAALIGAGVPMHIADFGACSSRPKDSTGLFVDRIGQTRAAGWAGWFVKVGNRSATAGAADPAGPFGKGPLATGSRILWFWCDTGGPCQQTLGLSVPATASPGGELSVRALQYDDDGRSSAASGVRVSLGMYRAVTGPNGSALIRVPSTAGMYEVNGIDVARPGGLFRAPAWPAKVLVRSGG